MKEIIVKVSLKTGETKVEANGFTGASCEASTKAIIEALGEPASVERKAEYYEQEVVHEEVVNHAG